MDHHDQIDIERELRAAMAERTAALPSPRIDLRAIRQRTAMRRRLLVPVITTALALATAAPFAIAQSGLFKARPTGSTVARTVTPPQSSSSGQPGATRIAPNGPQVVPPGSSGTGTGSRGGDQSSKGPGSGAVSGGCTNLRGPLTAAERAALSSDAEAVMEKARADLSGALAKLGGPSGARAVGFGDDLLNGLLPKAGTMVDQVDCAGQQHLAAAQRKAMLDQVRASVLSMGLVTGVIMDRTTGWLGISAGDMSAGVGFVRMTRDSLLMTGTLKSGGLLKFEKTITVTMRLPDCGVTKVDLSDLGLPGMSVSDLRRSLDNLSSGMQGVVPGILEPDATIVSLSTS